MHRFKALCFKLPLQRMLWSYDTTVIWRFDNDVISSSTSIDSVRIGSLESIRENCTSIIEIWFAIPELLFSFIIDRVFNIVNSLIIDLLPYRLCNSFHCQRCSLATLNWPQWVIVQDSNNDLYSSLVNNFLHLIVGQSHGQSWISSATSAEMLHR